MKYPISFADRLFGKLTGKTDDGNIDEIIACDSRLQEIVDDLSDKESVRTELRKMNKFNVDNAWNAVCEKATSSVEEDKHYSWKLMVPLLRVAAVAAAILAGIVLLVPSVGEHETVTNLDDEIIAAMNECSDRGLSGAVIETGYKAKSVEKKPERVIVDDISENECEAVAELLSATRVTTYYNKEYWLTLPDGTVVHLARNTRIIYPERFPASQRDVYLEGEAYFIVAKNPSSRFVVHTDAATTVAYGTEFNVCATDSVCSVALVNGSVGVSALDGVECRLQPGELAMVDGNKITVGEADIEPIKAWNTGRVDFSGWKLRRVLDVLARWHGMTVELDDDGVSEIELSGYFDRYDDLLPTLESITELTGAEFTVDGHRITVSR